MSEQDERVEGLLAEIDRQREMLAGALTRDEAIAALGMLRETIAKEIEANCDCVHCMTAALIAGEASPVREGEDVSALYARMSAFVLKR